MAVPGSPGVGGNSRREQGLPAVVLRGLPGRCGSFRHPPAGCAGDAIVVSTSNPQYVYGIRSSSCPANLREQGTGRTKRGEFLGVEAHNCDSGNAIRESRRRLLDRAPSVLPCFLLGVALRCREGDLRPLSDRHNVFRATVFASSTGSAGGGLTSLEASARPAVPRSSRAVAVPRWPGSPLACRREQAPRSPRHSAQRVGRERPPPGLPAVAGSKMAPPRITSHTNGSLTRPVRCLEALALVDRPPRRAGGRRSAPEVSPPARRARR
jgi:hypothetical protein